jgi:hypothetical protein
MPKHVFRIFALLFFIVGCHKPTVVVLNQEEHHYTIDKNGDVILSKNLPEASDSQISKKTTLTYQFQRVVINFSNGTSLIFKPMETDCFLSDNSDSLSNCLEENFLAAICTDDKQQSTILCLNDTALWELNVLITQNKEGIDSSSFKLKKYIFNSDKKRLSEKMVWNNYPTNKPS